MMPIYEYLCSSCNNKFELLRPMSQAKENTSCPICKAAAERLLSPFSRIFEGSSNSNGVSKCGSCSSGSCSSCS
ncbi:FmdB family zinc ribbon protein [Chloroflexota bacterium]